MAQPASSTPPAPATGPASGLAHRAWQQIRDFAGLGGDATYLWPRWLVLRAVGIVYLFVFGGILREGQALIGPHGIAPLGEFFAELHRNFPSLPEALIRVPSLFWFNQGEGMITFLSWAGFAAAIAVVLNLWPRMSLFACWLIFVSFVTTWRVFTPAQLDRLMLEVALLCIPFAPAGFRPGLGTSSPPRPIAVFMIRWMLFRVMFEDGVVKLTSGDPHWRNLSAMEVMYETSPFPTIFGYIDHGLPHAYHVFEIVLTFVAELASPLLAIFAGRRGRWFCFWTWLALQAGIQLTSNFGWLNTAAIGLSLLLFDDQMFIAAATRLRLSRLAGFLSNKVANITTRTIGAFKLHGLRVALWAHFYLTLFFFAKVFGVAVDNLPYAVTWPVHLVWEFRSANGYYLYATFDPVRFQVEFEGSNDGGQTWRTYEFRHIPQREDRVCPFIAPWFCRFEATLQIAGWNGKKSPLMPAVAAHLLVRDQAVMDLFARDPFPDAPPTMIRMRGYRMFFTDFATHHRTGKYWRREPAGNYLPMLYLDERGAVVQSDLTQGDDALRNRDYAAALEFFAGQYRRGNFEAGYRLADIYLKGLGVPPDPARAQELYVELAGEGEVNGEFNVGVSYEFGRGVPANFALAAKWYRLAARHGSLAAVFSLGALHAKDRVTPPDDIEGLALLIESEKRAMIVDDPVSGFILQHQPEFARRLKARMSPGDIALATARAEERMHSAVPGAELDPR